ncbi:transforming growth factor beta receptor type 3-like [Periplaneta americana]|uniref:transforming growth factor beta receptor type 3-like n=1 Tax=Periplaneta americana TaxID=6978 RepID=UPI0037E74C69
MCKELMTPAAMQPTVLSSCLFFALSILLGCRSIVEGSSDNPELCIMKSLVTPYFIPLLDTPRKTRGCSIPYKAITTRARSKTHLLAQLQEVHVIMLHSTPETPPMPVKLSVNFSQGGNESDADVLGRLILVLNSDHPVAWELAANLDNEDNDNDDLYSSPQPLILVSEGSSVKGNFKFNLSHKMWPNKKALQRFVKREYPMLASYTEVKGANHMELRVGSILNLSQNPGLGDECNINDLRESNVLTASSTVQLKTEGCFHEDYIGDNQVDVYVVELDAGAKGNRPNRAPLPVLIHLQGEGIRPVPRNVTLVLKSHQPIRWQFGANGINGNIIVVSDREDQVENYAVENQNLEVRSKPLPDNLPDLLLSVTAEFGPPILYAKTGRASTLRLLVGTTRNKAGLRSGPEVKLVHGVPEPKLSKPLSTKPGRWDEEEQTRNTGSHELMQQQPNYPGAALLSGLRGQEPQVSAVVRLRAAMMVDCGKTRITVSFPASLVHELGITRLSLNDASCVSRSNGTHELLSSLITSCGSTGDSDGKVVSSTNAIHVSFGVDDNENDDEDFEESSGWYGDGSLEVGKIPIVCKYHPHFPISKPGLDTEDPLTGTEDVVLGGTSSKMTLYHMELYRDKGHMEHIDFTSPDPSVRETEFDETLYVRAWIDGVVPVQVVTENCWISNSSNPHQVSSRMVLLRNTCPVDLSVEIQAQMDAGNNSRSQRSAHGGFSFQVNKEYESLGQFYVHCRLGLCTSDPAHVKGNLIMCVDPRQYCSRQSLRPFLDKAVSTAQQLASKGPLRPVPRRRRVPTVQVASSSEAPAEGRPKIIYVGVSTEVTVGIALASFAIGVGLTGALWCIHMKTDPFRRQVDKQLPGARAGVGAGVVTGCNLSPHSGCSSTNSQAAMTAT